MKHVLITYDVETTSKGGAPRLRAVAKACERYGERVQYSVFEVSVGEKDYVLLLGELEEAIDHGTDSIRIYSIKREHVSTLGRTSITISTNDALVV